MRFGTILYALFAVLLAYTCFRLGALSQKEHSTENITKGPISFPYFYSKGSSQKLAIYTQQWTVENPNGIIFIAHGFGEHSGRYHHVAEKFNEAGYSVYALDHIGHGKSDGDRCHVEDFQHYTDDLLHYVEITLRGLGKEYPVFLLGHSMGGLIAIQTALQTPTFWNGVIISGPALTLPSDFLQTLADYLGNFIPKFPVYGMRIPPTALSRDELHVSAYFNDPLVYRGPMKSLWGHTIINAMKRVIDSYEKATFPFVILHGEDDIICKVNDSQKFYDNASSTDKLIVRYPELRHEIMNEIERDVVIADIVNWIVQRT